MIAGLKVQLPTSSLVVATLDKMHNDDNLNQRSQTNWWNQTSSKSTKLKAKKSTEKLGNRQLLCKSVMVFCTEADPGGGDVGDASPVPAIFIYVFDDYNFSVISNLFDSNRPEALSSQN